MRRKDREIFGEEIEDILKKGEYGILSTVPAFISPNVLNYLVEHYNIAPITTPLADMQEML